MLTTMKSWPLRLQLVVLTMLAVAAPLALSGVVFASRVSESLERLASKRLEEQGTFITEQLGRYIRRKREALTKFAKGLDLAAPGKLSERLTIITQTDSQWTWLAVADMTGKVLASSEGAPANQSVFYQQWFRAGQKTPFVGDAYREPAQPGTLESADAANAPRCHMPFSIPMKNAGNQTVAVLGGSFDCTQMKEAIQDLGGRNVEVIVLSKNRNVLFGPSALEKSGTPFGLGIPAIEAGPVTRIVHGVDGPHFLTVEMPEISCSDLPSFGWTLILRENVDVVFSGARALFKTYWMLTGVAGLAMLVGVYAVALYVSRPLTEAADFATRLASGEDAGLPPEPSGGGEARSLLAALTRLQSLLQTKPLQTPKPAAGHHPARSGPGKFRRLRMKLGGRLVFSHHRP